MKFSLTIFLVCPTWLHGWHAHIVQQLVSIGTRPQSAYVLTCSLKVPKNYSVEFIMVGGDTVTNTIQQWGNMMRKYYGKDDSYRKSDFSINYLGYIGNDVTKWRCDCFYEQLFVHAWSTVLLHFYSYSHCWGSSKLHACFEYHSTCLM